MASSSSLPYLLGSPPTSRSLSLSLSLSLSRSRSLSSSLPPSLSFCLLYLLKHFKVTSHALFSPNGAMCLLKRTFSSMTWCHYPSNTWAAVAPLSPSTLRNAFDSSFVHVSISSKTPIALGCWPLKSLFVQNNLPTQPPLSP